jgi:hypothetical protein
MGAQASTNKVKTEVQINNEAINKCGSTTVTNAILLKKAKITCPKDCAGKCTLNINQGAAVDATCLIQAHQDALSESMAAMDAKTKAGLGFGASTNVSDMKKIISNKIHSECGGASSTQKIDASEMQLEMCNVTFAQNATAKSKCELGALQALRDKTETVAKATTEGIDPFGFMKAYAAIIGIIVFVIIIIIGAAIYFTSSGASKMMSSNSGMPGGMGMSAPGVSGMMGQLGNMAQQQMGGMVGKMGGPGAVGNQLLQMAQGMKNAK